MTEPTVKSTEPVALGIPSRKLTIGLYLASVFLSWMAQYIYLPTSPTYVQSKQKACLLDRSLCGRDAPFFVHLRRSRPYRVAGVGIGPTTQGL